jgi:hypothetical protein
MQRNAQLSGMSMTSKFLTQILMLLENIDLIWQEFGSIMDLLDWCRKIHDYFGIQIDFTEAGKAKMTMYDYTDELINETPKDLIKGTSATPAANHLFAVDPECNKLNEVDGDLYHHLTAKLLYLSKWTWADLLLAVSFWRNRWQILTQMTGRNWVSVCITCPQPNIFLFSLEQIILALFSGGSMCCLLCTPTCRVILGDPVSWNRVPIFHFKDAETQCMQIHRIWAGQGKWCNVAGFIDMQFLAWSGFFHEQQCDVSRQPERHSFRKNGKMSSSKHTCHLDIWYFFLTDQAHKKYLQVQYCLTDKMITKFFTRPLQGTKFRRFQDIMGCCSRDMPKECVVIHGADMEVMSPVLWFICMEQSTLWNSPSCTIARKDLQGALQEWGFALHLYKKSVANKVINEKQCTMACWWLEDITWGWKLCVRDFEGNEWLVWSYLLFGC